VFFAAAGKGFPAVPLNPSVVHAGRPVLIVCYFGMLLWVWRRLFFQALLLTKGLSGCKRFLWFLKWGKVFFFLRNCLRFIWIWLDSIALNIKIDLIINGNQIE
jgi:hypothetical protein